MALQRRTVGQAEAQRILAKLGAVLRRQEGQRFTYWSDRLGSWIVVDRLVSGNYVLAWEGTKDCGC